MVSWQECLESEEPRLPLWVWGWGVSPPRPPAPHPPAPLPPAAHESGFPAPVISLLPASQAVLQTQVGNDRFFLLAPRGPNRGKYVKHAAQECASSHWPRLAGAGRFSASTSAAQVSHELVSSVSQPRLYLFSFLQKINPEVGSASGRSGSRAFPLLEAGLLLGRGTCSYRLRAPRQPESEDSLLKGVPRGLPDLLLPGRPGANPFQTPEL